MHNLCKNVDVCFSRHLATVPPPRASGALCATPRCGPQTAYIMQLWTRLRASNMGAFSNVPSQHAMLCSRHMMCMIYEPDIFETPVTVTPQQENFKNFKFFKNSLKRLNVYFWGTNVYFWGTNVYFWG